MLLMTHNKHSQIEHLPTHPFMKFMSPFMFDIGLRLDFCFEASNSHPNQDSDSSRIPEHYLCVPPVCIAWCSLAHRQIRHLGAQPEAGLTSYTVPFTRLVTPSKRYLLQSIVRYLVCLICCLSVRGLTNICISLCTHISAIIDPPHVDSIPASSASDLRRSRTYVARAHPILCLRARRFSSILRMIMNREAYAFTDRMLRELTHRAMPLSGIRRARGDTARECHIFPGGLA